MTILTSAMNGCLNRRQGCNCVHWCGDFVTRPPIAPRRAPRHRCEFVYPSDCPEHVHVWGGLVPVEQFRAGFDGRHRRPDDVLDTEVTHNP
jgi:hypothetical protein